MDRMLLSTTYTAYTAYTIWLGEFEQFCIIPNGFITHFTVLTTSAGKHNKKHRVEEAKGHGQNVLVEYSWQQENGGHCSYPARLAKQLKQM